MILLLSGSALLGGCSLRDRLRSAASTTSTPAKVAETPQPPKVEEVKTTITENRSSDRATVALSSLVLLRDQESLLTASLNGDWDQRHAVVEKANREEQSKYKVWMRLEWKSTKPFPIGNEDLHFLADDRQVDLGKILVFFPMAPVESGDPYLARMTAKIPLNYLEQITVAQQVEMRLGEFKLNLDQNALSKLKEFADRAVQIRSEQMAKKH